MEYKKRDNAPFKCYVDEHGYFTKEYKDWCVQLDNYIGSGLMIEDLGSEGKYRIFNDLECVETYPFNSKEDADNHALEIRRLGGVAIVTSFMRNKKKMYKIWFNPNGNHEARLYVAGW